MPLVSTSSPSGAPSTPRLIEVAPERLSAWLGGFAERHGGQVPSGRPNEVRGADGVRASFAYFDHDPLGVILVRRGGYAVGRVRGGKLLLHKVGTRYVQSRTAAGGWSQQRYARRRDNQADELVGAVVEHAARILVDLAHVPEETEISPSGPARCCPAWSSAVTVNWSRPCSPSAACPRSCPWPAGSCSTCRIRTAPSWRRRSSAPRPCGSP